MRTYVQTYASVWGARAYACVCACMSVRDRLHVCAIVSARLRVRVCMRTCVCDGPCACGRACVCARGKGSSTCRWACRRACAYIGLY